MRRSAIGLIGAGLFVCLGARAELAPPLHDALTSASLGQARNIDVYLPRDADKNPAQKYETIYVLDGEWNTELVVHTVDFIEARGLMPPVIVVSVPNHIDDGVNSRDHDLTPSVQPHEAHSGGAAQFTTFLKNELIPYVKKRYPSNGVNLVHGHSYGGLFLAYVIANDPGRVRRLHAARSGDVVERQGSLQCARRETAGRADERQSRLHRRPRRTRVQRHGRGFAANRIRESAEGSAVESGGISGRIA